MTSRSVLGTPVPSEDVPGRMSCEATSGPAGGSTGTRSGGRSPDPVHRGRDMNVRQAPTEATVAHEPTTRELRRVPLVIVHTGDGKGKSTAAFGLLLRAWGQGWPIGVFQFVKSSRWRTGEQAAFAELHRAHEATHVGAPIAWHTLGDGWTFNRRAGGAPQPADLARAAWDLMKEAIAQQTFGMILADELTHPIRYGWLDADEVAATLRDRPGHQHVIVTGRGCPQPVLDVADLITEMRKVRHPFDSGHRGQAGIEW